MQPTRNLKYRAWIRTLPCLVCGTMRGVEAAHTGPNGLGQKSPDNSCIPLCRHHHQTGRDSYHKLGPRAFEQQHGLNIRAVVARLNLKPTLRLEGGLFIGRYLDEDYVLGPVCIGVFSAVQQIVNIKRDDRDWLSLRGVAEAGFQAESASSSTLPVSNE